MRDWAVAVFAVAAVGAAALVIVVASRGAVAMGSDPRRLTDAIEDCRDTIQRMESELDRLRPGSPALT